MQAPTGGGAAAERPAVPAESAIASRAGWVACAGVQPGWAVDTSGGGCQHRYVRVSRARTWRFPVAGSLELQRSRGPSCWEPFLLFADVLQSRNVYACWGNRLGAVLR